MELRPLPTRAAILVFVGGLSTQLGPAPAQEVRPVTVLRIHILEGDSAVHGVSTRANRPLTVQITDETGRPVEGVAVNFRLPAEEPSGSFANGLQTDVQVTGPDGRVSIPMIQWGSTAGPLRIRVTAAKGEARAGIYVSQYLTDLAQAEGEASGGRDPDGRGPAIGKGKLLTAALLAAGAVAGGLVLSRGASGPSVPVAGAAGASTQQPTQVGPPIIRVTAP
jgi:hypothetical protein